MERNFNERFDAFLAKEIRIRTGLSSTTVSKFFTPEKMALSAKTLTKIDLAIDEIMEEIQACLY